MKRPIRRIAGHGAFSTRGDLTMLGNPLPGIGGVIMTSAQFIAAILLFQAAILFSPVPGVAQISPAAALTGRVSSQEEGSMEGVLVNARRTGSTFTVTVVSDQQGRYSFPRNRLEPGQYAVSIRAVGYDLEDPGTVEIAVQNTTLLDLKLRKTQNLASQLTNAEWLMSMPGTEKQKSLLYCAFTCHTLEPIVRSHHNAAEWMKVMRRMGTYHPGSIRESPQLLSQHERASGTASEIGNEGAFSNSSSAMAEYLSTINLSSVSQWKYPLKTLPRPKGKGTNVIVTQYDLPRRHIVPHDITVDREGMVWYCDFRESYLGRLDPKTAKVVEYPVPVVKPNYPKGCRTVEFDPEGNIWVSGNDQGAAIKFDRKTQKFQTWSVPGSRGTDPDPRVTNVQPQRLNVDGKVWAQSPRGTPYRGTSPDQRGTSGVEWMVQRLDARTGEWEQPINVYLNIPKDSPSFKRPHNIYDIYVDPQNNLYFTDRLSELIGRVDAKTSKITFYRTPTFDSGPRRGHFDDQGRFWFGEDRAGRIAMFDPKTEKIKEWPPLSTPYAGAYDVALDKNEYAWTGSMQTDRITRLNTKTGETVEYLLPRFTNLRKVEIDNLTNPPSFWVADSNHDGAATVTRVEPME
jgi:streptogramin lyase